MNIEDRPNHPRKTLGIDYYFRTLTLLIDCVRAGMSQKLTAKALNDAGLLAPSGSRWNVGILKAALHKLRTPDTHPSRLYQALSRLVMIGMISASDAQVLTTHPPLQRNAAVSRPGP